LTPILNLAFTSGFGGNRAIYMAARDAGGNSGWQTMDAAGVPPLPSTFPNPTGMSPGNTHAATNIVLTSNNTIGKSQCTISAQGSVVQSNGNTLSLTLPIAFKPALAAFKGVWLAAQTMNAAQTSAWQILGAEALPAQ